MRTTIEMRDDHRAKLLEIAARRGEKGFSKLVEEAIEDYLKREQEDRETRAREFQKYCGILSKERADQLREEVRRIREFWR